MIPSRWKDPWKAVCVATVWDDNFTIVPFDELFGWSGFSIHEAEYQTYYGFGEDGIINDLMHVPGPNVEEQIVDLDGNGINELVCTNERKSAYICFQRDGIILSEDVALCMMVSRGPPSSLTLEMGAASGTLGGTAALPACSTHPAKVNTQTAAVSRDMAHRASFLVFRSSAIRAIRSRSRFLSEDMGVTDSRGFTGRVWSNLAFAARLRKYRMGMEVPGCKYPVYMMESELDSPCLFGILRPAVYLTPAAIRSEESLRHVLAHEETHARHLDPLWSLLRSVCLAVYWFDPLVWIAVSASRTDCELACDEGGSPRRGHGL